MTTTTKTSDGVTFTERADGFIEATVGVNGEFFV